MTEPRRAPTGVGVYLAAVQFLFALGWIVYAIYLPQLAQQAGLDRRVVPWLLVADQLVFLATDLIVGMASDRAARVLGRIGRAVLLATLVSSAAFLALPWLAPQASPALFTAVGLLWATTSAALRAPPLTLLGRHVARPAQPMLIAIATLGLGIANALAPYLGLQLKALDPRWPFALSGLALAAVTLGMVAAERRLALASVGASPVPADATHAASAVARRSAGTAAETPAGVAVKGHRGWYLAACVVGALAFQWHAFVASSALYLQRTGADQLPWLLPVFWVGFNLALLPAGWMAGRLGAVATMAFGAEAAMIGAAGAAFAPGLELLVVAQFVTGAGWAMLLCAAFSAALVFGHTGREGLMSGALSSTLAFAALSRIAFTASQPLPGGTLAGWAWLAAAAFALCALLLMKPAYAR